jgi:uncharacterized surface anchored protein
MAHNGPIFISIVASADGPCHRRLSLSDNDSVIRPNFVGLRSQNPRRVTTIIFTLPFRLPRLPAMFGSRPRHSRLSSRSRFFRPLVESLESRHLLTGTITGRIWNDSNYDGVQDAAETNATNTITVQLISNHVVIAQTTTSDGNYSLTNVPAGTTYYLQFQLPTGMTLGPTNAASATEATDNDFATDSFGGTTASLPGGYLVVNDGDALQYDAGIVQGGRITARVWKDTNSNGLQDTGETGLASHIVNLKTWTYAYTDLTSDANGIADFTNVRPGSYWLEFWKNLDSYTLQDISADDTIDSDGDSLGDTVSFNVLPGATITDFDCGFVDTPITTGAISGTAWLDNGDGIRQAGETTLAKTMYFQAFQTTDNVIGNADDQFIRSGNTDASNNYKLDSLPVGTYYVQWTADPSYDPTLVDQGGDDTVDNDFNPTTFVTGLYTVTAGNTVTGVDLGLVPGQSKVGNFVWNDANANGIQDAGETGLAGAKVTLHTSTGATVGNQITTDATGAYQFTGFVAGDYYVQITPPAGYVASPIDPCLAI